MVKVQNGGITMEVNDGDVDLYKRAGYSVVGNEPVISAVDEKTIEKISAVTNVSDLYLFQVDGRSQAIEDAINAKGQELMELEKQKPEPAAPEVVEKPVETPAPATPEEQNAEAVKAVNEPKAKKK